MFYVKSYMLMEGGNISWGGFGNPTHNFVSISFIPDPKTDQAKKANIGDATLGYLLP